MAACGGAWRCAFGHGVAFVAHAESASASDSGLLLPDVARLSGWRGMIRDDVRKSACVNVCVPPRLHVRVSVGEKA